jgi:hypothetical protein
MRKNDCAGFFFLAEVPKGTRVCELQRIPPGKKEKKSPVALGSPTPLAVLFPLCRAFVE